MSSPRPCSGNTSIASPSRPCLTMTGSIMQSQFIGAGNVLEFAI
jgi:hypothetical protein